MVEVVTNIIGAIVLIVTAVGAYYANGLKSALAGSELAEVWKYMGFGVILLFIGAIAGGAAKAENIDFLEPLDVVLVFMAASAICLTYGLKLQLDKVK
jgi:hypothetical protein